MLWAEQTQVDQAAGWAVISSLAALLITFLVTARRDRRKSDSEAVLQWQALTANAVAERNEAWADRDRLVLEAMGDKVRIRELELELDAERSRHRPRGGGHAGHQPAGS